VFSKNENKQLNILLRTANAISQLLPFLRKQQNPEAIKLAKTNSIFSIY